MLLQSATPTPLKRVTYHEKNFFNIPQLAGLSKELIETIAVTAKVLPFKVNNYVINELIDWQNVPEDPIFQMTFPQPGMLSKENFSEVQSLMRKGKLEELKKAIFRIRLALNPHPEAQMSLNVPTLNGNRLEGIQHKYENTVLYFPKQGQTCHAYCTYCFRWAQFIGDKQLQFSSKEDLSLQAYLKNHKEVSDLLVTGGDPLVAKTAYLSALLLPLLQKDFNHITNIRIGTKALSYWPHRFVTDEDAEQLIHLFKVLIRKGKHIALMVHFNHPRELQTPMVKAAIQRLQQAGVVIRSQAPLLKHINDKATIWHSLWKKQVQLGIVPYYMFIERDTGPRDYFSLPLASSIFIFRQAFQSLPGLARTVRGPVMSTTDGKVLIEDILELNGQKCFALKFIQARDKQKVGGLFFAKFNADATWFDELTLI